MLRFIFKKLKNKKWLNLCLVSGIVILIAIFSCHPMFKKGSLDRLVVTEFEEYAEENKEYPAIIQRSGGLSISDSYNTCNSIVGRMRSYENKWNEYLEIAPNAYQHIVRVNGSNSLSNIVKTTKYAGFCYIEDLENHISLCDGESIADNQSLIDKGIIPCYLSENYMDINKSVIGETFTVDALTDGSGKPLVYQVVGIIKEKLNEDNFWNYRFSDLERYVFVDEASMDRILQNYMIDTVYYDQFYLLNYTEINSENVEAIKTYTDEFLNNDDKLTINYIGIINSYLEDAKSVNTILWVFELPIVVLLLMFIFMVSNQIIEMEANEIAMLKSRGISRRKIIGIYTVQSIILSLFAMIIGIPLGYLFCKGAASTDAFLQFSFKDVSIYSFTYKMLIYALLVGAFSVFFMLIPVIKSSKLTIIQQRSQRTLGIKEKPFWQKVFLDIILLGLSIYLLFNYNKQITQIAIDIIEGKSLDPILFLDSSLFIFAGGLVMLRLIKYLVRFIYYIGRKKWNPDMYVSFLQITRTEKKQGFISVFLVMTIAMGIFNANLARTINENNKDRITYDIGADAIIKETWNINVYKIKDQLLWSYDEPDFGRYDGLNELGVISKTRVIQDNNVEVKGGKKTSNGCTLMGINTKEFGETANLKEGLNDKHWFHALNSIAESPNGVIISRNMAEDFGIDVGNRINYSRFKPLTALSQEKIATVEATVMDIVDAFPGYQNIKYSIDENGNTIEEPNYLIVANYAACVSQFSITPYSVWIKLDPSADAEKFSEAASDYCRDNKIKSPEISSLDAEIRAMQSSALIQITNGIFTISFIISILLCAAGFLIYWILSIKKRSLLFGIYRAMGMTMAEINNMLINEQMFSSVLAVLGGGLIGIISTILFTNIIALVYLPKKHAITIGIIISRMDMLKLLAIIFVVFIICFIVLKRIIAKLRITEALKLGED